VDNLVGKMPEVERTDITYSGGRGFHVRGMLRKKTPTDDVRKRLENYLKEQNVKGTVVGKKPGKEEIRLDTSTLKNKGSLRAPYSINTDTGRVALPLTPRELRGFSPEKAELSNVLDSQEFAPGIRRSKRIYGLPNITQKKLWTMVTQEHQADRAGLHWDLRLVDPNTAYAHSWAVPKARLPKPGDRPVLAVRTPTHTENYATNFGMGGPRQIGKGYGKGTVEIKNKEPVAIENSSENRIKFERNAGKNPETFVLFKTKDDKWLLKNTTKTGSVNMSPYQKGYVEALNKMGLRKQAEEAASVPANDFVASLQQLEESENNTISPRVPTDNSVEERLNRDTRWSSPVDIPPGYMGGITTPIPGGGF
jgi:hypothetical protein